MCRRVMVLVLCVCMSVCLSVTTLAATAFVSTDKARYLRLSFRVFFIFIIWIFEKTFYLKIMAWKTQYANEIATHNSLFWELAMYQQSTEGQIMREPCLAAWMKAKAVFAYRGHSWSLYSNLCMFFWHQTLLKLPKRLTQPNIQLNAKQQASW